MQDNDTLDTDVQHSELRQLFDAVATRVRETTPFTLTVSNEDKLRLYGWYKHVTVGPCTKAAEAPSMLRVEARAKYQAWYACRKLTGSQAMEEYISWTTQQPDPLGQQCQALWKEYCHQTQEETSDTAQSSSSSSSSNGSSNGECQPTTQQPQQQETTISSNHKTLTSEGSEKIEQGTKSSTTEKSQTGTLQQDKRPFLARWLGLRRLIPRGQLDISYSTLAQAAWSCGVDPCSVSRSHQLEHDIGALWTRQQQSDTTASTKVVVGLSVRSLLDLYLLAQQYPRGSEILVTPAINVPGMMRVFQHHGLTVVGVDVDSSDDAARFSMRVRVQAVAEKITPRTKAILVVHPFGLVSATNEDWRALRELAKDHHLDLMEDCAQAFGGLVEGGFIGHPLADVSFFSFGFIKTATALGGGVALIRNHTNIQETMHRLQWRSECYGRQSKWQYLRTVLKALVFRLLSHNPYIYFCVYCCLTHWWKCDLDKVCETWLRSFQLSSQADASDSQMHSYMKQIRRAPCTPLLSVLKSRLESGSETRATVERRRKRAHQILFQLEKLEVQSKTTLSVLDQEPTAINASWLLPIRRPNLSLGRIRSTGIDVAQGLSQLQCVSSKRDCPNTSSLMKNIVYLPVTCTDMMSTHDISVFCQSLLQDEDKKKVVNAPIFWAKGRRWQFGLLLGICFYRYTKTTSQLLLFIGVAFLLLISLVKIVHWSIADFYVKQSTAFAKYSWLMQNNGKVENFQKVSDEHEPPKVIESMNCLKISYPNVNEEYSRSVFLTGATGFIGSMLLFDLVKHRKQLGLGKIILLCRAKRGKSPSRRIRHLLENKIFDFVSRQELEEMIEVLEGDVAEVDLGLSVEDSRRLLTDKSITHVFHSAASVTFTQTLENAAWSNISGPLNVQRLVSRMEHQNVTFLHISTAFVHGSQTGSPSSPLKESLFDLQGYEATEIYHSMVGSQYVASKCYEELSFPNTYTFSKCICEHLLSRSKVRTVILRPSIVGPSVQYPFEGWCGSKPSTFVAGACLYLKFQWNLWYFGPHTVPCIPVDVLSRFILSKAGDDWNIISSDVNLGACSIHNATWDANSPALSGFSWIDFAVCITQLGALLGYFSRFTAYIGLVLSTRILPSLHLDQDFFNKLHSVIVLGPFKLYFRVAEFLGLGRSNAENLFKFLDLPLLFFPFSASSFSFRSEMLAPSSFVGERYVFHSVLAAHAFLEHPKTSDEYEHDTSRSNVISDRNNSITNDFFWASTQPRGSFVERVAALVLRWILRVVCSEVTVDIQSFSRGLKEVHAMSKRRIVLAPTHRSFFDFLLMSYVCFAIPELQIDLPMIAAAAEFSKLSVMNLIIPLFRVFYVFRGRGANGLEEPTKQLKNCLSKDFVAVELYIEGTRSRDRRFVHPKTGLLRCCKQASTQCVVLPITINYERLPEQEALAREANNTRTKGLNNLMGLISWLKRAISGEVFLGRIHIEAAPCLPLDDMEDDQCKAFALNIQKRQRELVRVSSYHIAAISKVLSRPESAVHAAFERLKCPVWPHTTASKLLQLPDDSSELWTVALHAAHFLEPLVRCHHPQWASWLTPVPMEIFDEDILDDQNVKLIASSLSSLFSAADESVRNSLQELRKSGFNEPTPGHIVQIASKAAEAPPLLLVTAAAENMLKSEFGAFRNVSSTVVRAPVVPYEPNILPSKERLGFWGFHDTSFVLNCNKTENLFVSVTGDRYARKEKRFARLLPFIEKAVGTKIDPSKEQGLNLASLDQMASTSALGSSEVEKLKLICKEISLTLHDRVRHGTGHCLQDVYTIRFGTQPRVPDAVVWPTTDAEVVALVSFAAEQNLCLIPYGGGTSVSRAVACPSIEQEPRPIISVDMRKLNQVLRIDCENGLAFVQAGITGLELSTELRRIGYTVGHEPDSMEFSTLGGWIATKASGMKRNKYGNIEDIITGVRVASPDGIMEHGHCGRESCGLDLTSLMLGSEGCLGVIVSAVLRMTPLPTVSDHEAILLPNFEVGLAFVKDLKRQGSELPASLRLLDNDHFHFGQALRPAPDSILEQMKDAGSTLFAAYSSFSETQVVCLAIGYEGSKDQVSQQKRLVRSLTRDFGGFSAGRGAGKRAYDMTFMIAYLRDFALNYQIAGESFETFSPWSVIQNVVRHTKERIKREHEERKLPGKPFVGCRVTQFYSDGVCLYFYLCINVAGVPDPLLSFSSLETAARDEILKQGGSLSHHHGIGKHRQHFLSSVHSLATQKAMKKIKTALDPDNIFGAQNGHFCNHE